VKKNRLGVESPAVPSTFSKSKRKRKKNKNKAKKKQEHRK
jgi:hypothetical protein